MHRDACEATHLRGEQSAEVLDLRMVCLQERFNEVRALTNVFADANGEVVEQGGRSGPVAAFGRAVRGHRGTEGRGTAA